MKTADKSAVTAPGQVIAYTYTGQNLGQCALSNVVVTDDNGTPAYQSGDTNKDGVCDPGGMLDTSKHTVLQAEYNAAMPLTSTATARAGRNSAATVTVQKPGGINVVVATDKAAVSAVGQVVT